MINILCVIPARSGSKSIINKNIFPLNGLPLFMHSVLYAQKSKFIKRIYVSTDSIDYANIARSYGLEIPFLRPNEISKDDTEDYPVLRHALQECEDFYQEIFNYVLLLRPTSPIRKDGLIEKAINIMESDKKLSSTRAVRQSNQHYYRQFFIQNNILTQIEKNIYEPYNLPRQKLPNTYFQTGEIELIRRDTIIIEKSASGKNIAPLIIEDTKYFDIDNKEDIQEVSILFNTKN